MTVKFFFILTVLCVVSAISFKNQICGSESCNDLKTVKYCQNVNYCISSVWMRMVPTGERDNVCDICLRMVKEARDQLQSNETKMELKEVLEGSCKLMILKPAVKICKRLADEFVPELVEILSSQMDPETVCTIAKLCNNDMLKKELKNSVECTSCSEFMSSAANVFTKTPISELTMQYNNICRSLGTFSEACSYYLHENPEPFVSVTQKIFQNNPCEALGLCPRANVKELHQNLKSGRESKIQMCNICPKFMENLHELFKSTSDVEKQIYNICVSLSFANDACSKFAAEYSEMILSYFKPNISYEFMCSHGLGLCNDKLENSTFHTKLPTQKIGIVNFSNDMINVKTSTSNQSTRLTLPYGDPLLGSIIPLPEEKFLGSSSKDCETCIEMFQAASKYVHVHRDYVNSMLSAACYNAKNFDKCINFTSTYEHIFRSSKIFDPEKICPSIVPFCSGKSLIHLLGRKQYPNQDSCRFCGKLIQSLKNDFKTNAAELQVTSELKEACQGILEESKLMCEFVAENYIKNVVASVTLNTDNSVTCSRLNMCASTSSESLQSSKETCKTCLLVVETIYEELKDMSNEDEIRKILDGVCDKLSGKVKEYCVLLVDTYSDALVHLLIDNIDATTVCDKLRLCHSPKKNDLEKNLNIKLTTPVSSISITKVPCSFCLTAMKMLIDKLEDNKTEDAIKHILSELCSYMPTEVRDTCNNLISQYSEDIIDMIIADFNATEICIYLKICGPKAESLKSLLMFSPGFSISTNEVENKPHINGPCHFCQMMERSMAIRGFENKGAEGMLGLLVDVCMMDIENLYGDCAKKFSEEILPYGKEALLSMNNICSYMKICPKENLDKYSEEKKILQQLESSVQECAMCETIAAIVSSHEIMLTGNYNFVSNASLICSGVPGNRKKMCESMIVSYAPSMVNLSRKNVKRDDICPRLSLCDVSFQTKVNMPVTSIEQSGLKHLEESGDCLKGPSFWCSNLENSKKCGTTLHCQEVVWKGRTP